MKSLNAWFIIIASLLSGVVEGHNRSQSFSLWTLDSQQLQMLYTVPSREITRLKQSNVSSLEVILINSLKSKIKVIQDANECPLLASYNFQSLPSKPGYLRVTARFECPLILDRSPPELLIGSFFDVSSSHVHYAQIVNLGRAPMDYLFTEDRQRQVVELGGNSSSGSLAQALATHVQLGVLHILAGIDHLIFVLALLLLLPSRRALIWMISGFTLGHSVTLSLAVLGWVVPDIIAIEALIGFSIALVSAENIMLRNGSNRGIGIAAVALLGAMMLLSMSELYKPAISLVSLVGLLIFTLSYLSLVDRSYVTMQLRPFLCIAFGLIHGFGFASGFVDVGLPTDRLWSALLGFNLGVELGQLMVIGIVWVVYLGLANYRLATAYAAELCSALFCGIGLYWFVVRSYGSMLS